MWVWHINELYNILIRLALSVLADTTTVDFRYSFKVNERLQTPGSKYIKYIVLFGKLELFEGLTGGLCTGKEESDKGGAS